MRARHVQSVGGQRHCLHGVWRGASGWVGGIHTMHALSGLFARMAKGRMPVHGWLLPLLLLELCGMRAWLRDHKWDADHVHTVYCWDQMDVTVKND